MREAYNIIEQQLEYKKRIYNYYGMVKLEDLLTYKNSWFDMDEINRIENEKFIYGQDKYIDYSGMQELISYLELTINNNFETRKALFIEHVGGYIILDLTNSNHTVTIYSTDKNKIGHIIGKGGSNIKLLKNRVNDILRTLPGVKYQIKNIIVK